LIARVNPGTGAQTYFKDNPHRLVLDVPSEDLSNDLIAVLEAKTGIAWEPQPWVEGLRVGITQDNYEHFRKASNRVYEQIGGMLSGMNNRQRLHRELAALIPPNQEG